MGSINFKKIKKQKMNVLTEYLLVITICFVVGFIMFLYNRWKENRYLNYRAHILDMKNLELTLNELNEFDGRNHGVSFVCVDGDIFDVTDSPFYFEDGSYKIFRGKDASVSLAKHDLSGKYINTTHEYTLDKQENLTLKQWHQYYLEKYVKRGVV